jgi:hypothetical protein
MRSKVSLLLIFLVLIFSISSVSASIYEKSDDQSEFRYSNYNFKFSVYFNDASGFVYTNNYKQIGSIKIIDVNNKSSILRNNIDFKNNKTLAGYKADIDFSKRQLGLNNLKKVEVNFVKQPDLIISKISKNKKNYLITIKNKGDLTAGRNRIGMYVEKNGKYKLVRNVLVPKIQPNKSRIVKIKIVNAYIKVPKVFYVDYKDTINETNKENNLKIYNK